MEIIVWQNGEKGQRSNKTQKPIFNFRDEVLDNPRSTEQYISRKKNRETAEQREEILERHMIRRSYQNPFFENLSYLNVLDDQNKYLTPTNSNYK